MKTKIISGFVACVMLLGLTAFGIASAGGGGSANKLEGAWIAKVDGSTGQWSYVLSPDSSGRRASGHGSVDVGMYTGPFFETDMVSPILIEMEMTGPKTAAAYSVFYGLKDLVPTDLLDPNREIVYIGIVQSTAEFVAPNELEGVHYFAFYDASKDADGNGLPDPDEDPDFELTMTTTDTRLPSP